MNRATRRSAATRAPRRSRPARTREPGAGAASPRRSAGSTSSSPAWASTRRTMPPEQGEQRGQRLYPAFLKLEGLPVVVVGGGGIASSKLEGLLDAGARITVVAPWICDSIRGRAAASDARHVTLPITLPITLPLTLPITLPITLIERE